VYTVCSSKNKSKQVTGAAAAAGVCTWSYSQWILVSGWLPLSLVSSLIRTRTWLSWLCHIWKTQSCTSIC